MKPKLMLFDEPTSVLDRDDQRSVVMESWRRTA
jgi:energy-coupling factor transporter ATP-binding protein EcfA2